jgi:hypothetical protein
MERSLNGIGPGFRGMINHTFSGKARLEAEEKEREEKDEG